MNLCSNSNIIKIIIQTVFLQLFTDLWHNKIHFPIIYEEFPKHKNRTFVFRLVCILWCFQFQIFILLTIRNGVLFIRMTSFNILFDKEDNAYKGGETVTVKVRVTVCKRFKARSLSLEFFGQAHVEFVIGNIRYTGIAKYFNHCHYFFGEKNGNSFY